MTHFPCVALSSQAGLRLPTIVPSRSSRALEVVDILGQGSSSIVYKVMDSQHADRLPLAAKWCRKPAGGVKLKDGDVLRDLNRRDPSHPGIPLLVDECGDGTLLMVPVGQVSGHALGTNGGGIPSVKH